MKYLIRVSVFLCTFGCCSFVFAQTSKFTIAVESAINSSYLSTPSYSYFNYFYDQKTLGFTNTITIAYNFKEKLSLKSGLAFESKALNFYYASYIPDCNTCDLMGTHVEKHLEYLTLPVMLEASFGKKIKYFFSGGAYIGALLNPNSPTTSTTTSIPLNLTTSNHFDTGLSWGVGMKIPVGKNLSIPVAIRGTYSLLPEKIQLSGTFIYPGYIDLPEGRLLTKNISVGLAYSFGERK